MSAINSFVNVKMLKSKQNSRRNEKEIKLGECPLPFIQNFLPFRLLFKDLKIKM
jgi:hypothetical protein